jgi:hypothetical protein
VGAFSPATLILSKKRGDEMPKKIATKLPSLKEVDAMARFDSNAQECTSLCHDLLNTIEELALATGIGRLRLLARLRAIRGHMLALKCRHCLPD